MKQLLNLTLIILLAGCNRSGQETQPVRKEITQAVYASGKLYPIGHYTVFSKIPGYVERVFVSAGQSVHRGDPLVSVRNETNEMNLESARNLVELAKLQASQHGPVLSGLDQEVRAAKARYLLDSTNATRTASLWQQQATSRQQLDQAQTQFKLSKTFSTPMRRRRPWPATTRHCRVDWDGASAGPQRYWLRWKSRKRWGRPKRNACRLL